ncbi:hypothetical protein NKH18_12990 [Streptomyces sp. M10(2022)]
MAIPLLLIGFLFVVQGAGQNPELESEQVVGVWEGSGGGQIVFHTNGTFEMARIPRSAIVFSFVDAPPGKAGCPGGAWELDGEGDTSGAVELHFDTGGAFSDDGESALLQVDRGGDEPEMYFDTNVDKGYGYEVRRVERVASP